MTQALRIVIAEDDTDTREVYGMLLKNLGHEVVGVVANGRDLVALCDKLKPDLVLSDIRMPELDGIEAADQIGKREPVPIIFSSAYYDEKLIKRAQLSHVFAYLVKPLKDGDLETAIAVAMGRFQELQAVRAEAATLKQALSDRKIIERAKGIVMQHLNVSEQEAFKRLQKISWDKNEKLVKIAEMILVAQGAIAPFEKRVESPASNVDAPAYKIEPPLKRSRNGSGRHYLGRGLRPKSEEDKS